MKAAVIIPLPPEPCRLINASANWAIVFYALLFAICLLYVAGMTFLIFKVQTN